LTAPRGEMTPAIKLGDVVNFFGYEKVREERRRRVIALKARRREEVGLYLSFVFEKRPLLPGPCERSAIRFIEIAEKEEIKPVLDRFMGIDTCARPPLPGGRTELLTDLAS
jgi:uncharacterized protein DUF3501